MSGRLNKLSGWQRLWLVLTLLAIAVFGLALPYLQVSKSYPYDYQQAARKDYNNPDCVPYFTLPFEQLAEPKFGEGGTCWHIYTSRQFEAGSRAFATYDEWLENDNADWWGRLWGWLAASSALVLVLAIVVYGLGKVIAWVVRGFRTDRQG